MKKLEPTLCQAFAGYAKRAGKFCQNTMLPVRENALFPISKPDET